jgi:CDP-diacylglycerol--serine O-phosphatidyltransferase
VSFGADEPREGPGLHGEGRRRRRRRRSERRREGRNWTQLLPNLFTTANLAAGFYAIVKAMDGDYDRAALALVVAGVCDNLDGRLARLADATSRFEGLPSPAAAGCVAASVWFAGFLRESGLPLDLPAVLPGLGAAALGLLMVSPIPYRSFKEVHVRGRYRATVLMVIAFAVILSKPSVTLFLLGVGYAASGPFEWWWRWRTGRSLEELGPPGLAGEPAEETPR